MVLKGYQILHPLGFNWHPFEGPGSNRATGCHIFESSHPFTGWNRWVGWGEISFRAEASGRWGLGRVVGEAAGFFVVPKTVCPTLVAPTGVLGQQKSPKSDSQIVKDIHIRRRWWWCFHYRGNHPLKIRTVEFRCHNPRDFLMGLWPGIPRNFHDSKNLRPRSFTSKCVLGGGLKDFSFSPRTLGKCSNSTIIFVKRVGLKPPTRFNSKACTWHGCHQFTSSKQANAIDEYGDQRLEKIKNSRK